MTIRNSAPAAHPAPVVAQATGTKAPPQPQAVGKRSAGIIHTMTDAPTDLPWYQPVGDEVQLFEAAWDARLPVLL